MLLLTLLSSVFAASLFYPGIHQDHNLYARSASKKHHKHKHHIHTHSHKTHAGSESRSNTANQAGSGLSGLNQATEGCPTWVWVNVRSTNESPSSPASTREIAPAVLKAVPGGQYYELPYPATNDVTSPQTGASLLNEYMKRKTSSCPDTKFVVWGYSQGAVVVHSLLLQPWLNPNSVAAVLLEGDEFWVAGKPYSRGTAKVARGRQGGDKGLHLQPGIPPVFDDVTINLCDEGDTVCSNATGPESEAHVSPPR